MRARARARTFMHAGVRCVCVDMHVCMAFLVVVITAWHVEGSRLVSRLVNVRVFLPRRFLPHPFHFTATRITLSPENSVNSVTVATDRSVRFHPHEWCARGCSNSRATAVHISATWASGDVLSQYLYCEMRLRRAITGDYSLQHCYYTAARPG